jgi:hypothetical protein
MYYDDYAISFVMSKIKDLPYVKDYHLQTIYSDRSRNKMSKTTSKLKLRLWIVENVYFAEILSGQSKIECILKDIQKVHLLSYDIFYV